MNKRAVGRIGQKAHCPSHLRRSHRHVEIGSRDFFAHLRDFISALKWNIQIFKASLSSRRMCLHFRFRAKIEHMGDSVAAEDANILLRQAQRHIAAAKNAVRRSARRRMQSA